MYIANIPGFHTCKYHETKNHSIKISVINAGPRFPPNEKILYETLHVHYHHLSSLFLILCHVLSFLNIIYGLGSPLEGEPRQWQMLPCPHAYEPICTWHVCISLDFYGLTKLGKGRQDPCERRNDLYLINWVKVVNTHYYISAKLCG